MTNAPVRTDCCVVGGGPAGIMVGYLLARASVSVIVLEKWQDFFRDFRGDTIHPSTMEALGELGCLEDFLRLPHSKTRQMTISVGGEPITLTDFSNLPVRCPFVAMVPQWDFLNFLAGEARKLPCFDLRLGTEAVDLLEEEGRVVGVRARADGSTLDIRARLVIGADGRRSRIRERAGLDIETLGAPMDVLWFRLPSRAGSAERSFGYVDAGKALVMLNRGDYWQCGLIIEKGTFGAVKARGLEAFRAEIARLAPPLEPTLHALTDWEEVRLLSVAVDRVKKWYKDGLLVIGDAAHAMSPIGGIGINLAIQDAIAAARILAPAFFWGGPKSADLAAVQRRRELPTRLMQRMQVAMHSRVIAPMLRSRGRLRPPLVMRLFNRFPRLRAIPGRLIGMGFRPEHVSVTRSR